MLDKVVIRKDILALRKALAPELLRAHARAATAHILALPAWQNARRILLYMPIAQELDTTALVAHALQSGKDVFLPRCNPKQKGIMDVAQCRSLDELVVGAYGILEPDPVRCPKLDLALHGTPNMASNVSPDTAPHMAIVPAVAFDVHGNRLGYGGGYYDRFLAHEAMAHTFLLGLAHHMQVLDELPREPWDCTMHAVCTERGVMRTSPTAMA